MGELGEGLDAQVTVGAAHGVTGEMSVTGEVRMSGVGIRRRRRDHPRPGADLRPAERIGGAEGEQCRLVGQVDRARLAEAGAGVEPVHGRVPDVGLHDHPAGRRAADHRNRERRLADGAHDRGRRAGDRGAGRRDEEVHAEVAGLVRVPAVELDLGGVVEHGQAYAETVDADDEHPPVRARRPVEEELLDLHRCRPLHAPVGRSRMIQPGVQRTERVGAVGGATECERLERDDPGRGMDCADRGLDGADGVAHRASCCRVVGESWAGAG